MGTKWTKARREAQGRRLRKAWKKRKANGNGKVADAGQRKDGIYCPHCNGELVSVVEVTTSTVADLRPIG